MRKIKKSTKHDINFNNEEKCRSNERSITSLAETYADLDDSCGLMLKIIKLTLGIRYCWRKVNEVCLKRYHT